MNFKYGLQNWIFAVHTAFWTASFRSRRPDDSSSTNRRIMKQKKYNNCALTFVMPSIYVFRLLFTLGCCCSLLYKDKSWISMCVSILWEETLEYASTKHIVSILCSDSIIMLCHKDDTLFIVHFGGRNSSLVFAKWTAKTKGWAKVNDSSWPKEP